MATMRSYVAPWRGSMSTRTFKPSPPPVVAAGTGPGRRRREQASARSRTRRRRSRDSPPRPPRVLLAVLEQADLDAAQLSRAGRERQALGGGALGQPGGGK